MHLFHSRQTGTISAIPDLLENLSYYIRFAVEVPRLNSSLHTQLKRNFESRYPGCTPQGLKRTALEQHLIGKDYFYNLLLADDMLQLDQAWTGRKNDGLRLEFEMANVNLSLVDSQIVSRGPSSYNLLRLTGYRLSFKAGGPFQSKLATLFPMTGAYKSPWLKCLLTV